ncbi:uncharacterized protein LOC119163910 isoform X1 [Rhipicephalus microplus]|uniref:uncharacterized protein LOC119163910 isoform X1 n=1 Tax=Rhipicephalus microplus TaxID=6941 RepID=UPI003F6D4A5C
MATIEQGSREFMTSHGSPWGASSNSFSGVWFATFPGIPCHCLGKAQDTNYCSICDRVLPSRPVTLMATRALAYMPLFPGHQYLGSGNPLRNGYSVDEDNGIAKSHDEAYKRATSRKDVFAADHVSAALFVNYFRRTGSSHRIWKESEGIVGCAAVHFKYCANSCIL